MATHTARLIITVLFLIVAFSNAVAGHWFVTLAWAVLAFAVGYPFVRNGRIDLNYDEPQSVILYQGEMLAAGNPLNVAPLAVPLPPTAPAGLQSLVAGNLG